VIVRLRLIVDGGAPSEAASLATLGTGTGGVLEIVVWGAGETVGCGVATGVGAAASGASAKIAVSS